MGRKGSFANEVRKVFLSDTSREWTAAALAEKLDLVGGADKKPMYAAVTDMAKAGEIKKVRPGVYAWANKAPRPQLRKVIWKLIRASKKTGRAFDIAGIAQLSGAKESYVKEVVAGCIRNGVVRRVSKHGQTGRYRLVKDVVESPEDARKKARLRELRRRKKQGAMRYIQNARQALVDAEAAIMEGWDE